MAAYELTDEGWELVSDLFAPPVGRAPRASVPRRQVVEAILWLARTGAQWCDLPDRYGNWTAAWAQWRRWRDKGVWDEALRHLNAAVRDAEGRDLQPSVIIIDAQTTRGTKRSTRKDTPGLPVAARADSAHPHDSRLASCCSTTPCPVCHGPSWWWPTRATALPAITSRRCTE